MIYILNMFNLYDTTYFSLHINSEEKTMKNATGYITGQCWKCLRKNHDQFKIFFFNLGEQGDKTHCMKATAPKNHVIFKNILLLGLKKQITFRLF